MNIDVIHDHTHNLVIGHEHLDVPTISTIHTESSLNIPVKFPLYVSKTKLLQSTNSHNGAYVHNGIDLEAYTYSKKKEEFLLYLGRIALRKGVEDVISLGKRTGIRTIIAGPVWNKNFFKRIYPIIERTPNITYVGEVHGEEKQALISRAKWLVFPNGSHEQFGIVIVEALACGTPIAVYNRGAVPEVLKGLPMFVCENLEHMERLVTNDSPVHPKHLRKYVAKKFTTEKMTNKYLKLYQRAIDLCK